MLADNHETAELLQVSQRTVNRMIQDKKLSAFKVGGQWRVRASQLTKWIQGLCDVRYLELMKSLWLSSFGKALIWIGAVGLLAAGFLMLVAS